MSFLVVDGEGKATTKHIVSGCYGRSIFGRNELHLEYTRLSSIQLPGTVDVTREACELSVADVKLSVRSQRAIRHGFGEVQQDVFHSFVTAVLYGEGSLKRLTGEGEQLVELQFHGDDDIIVRDNSCHCTVAGQNGFAVVANRCKCLTIAGFRFIAALPGIDSQPRNAASLVALFLAGVADGDKAGLLRAQVKGDGVEGFPAETFYLRHSKRQVTSLDESAIGQRHLHVDMFSHSHLADLQSAWRRDGDLRSRNGHL